MIYRSHVTRYLRLACISVLLGGCGSSQDSAAREGPVHTSAFYSPSFTPSPRPSPSPSPATNTSSPAFKPKFKPIVENPTGGLLEIGCYYVGGKAAFKGSLAKLDSCESFDEIDAGRWTIQNTGKSSVSKLRGKPNNYCNSQVYNKAGQLDESRGGAAAEYSFGRQYNLTTAVFIDLTDGEILTLIANCNAALQRP
ncbi:hypothetical protein Val02_42620 [Virgisporangium aliadipatigenens]|uniref:Uncharacterized protein n=1 Tax=Virgisporangium aliadipatigenens TaxID=741659 RepID=A0A8J3YP51_9ACTN|nr:hypothetical protein Val02_42620 [Virgisporangium aliadipatigenens]